MNAASPCSICSKGGHGVENCPTLSEPLKRGFSATPPGGDPSGGDDDGDEKIDVKKC